MWLASEVVIDYDLSIASHLDRCNYEKQVQLTKTCQCDLDEITSAKTYDGRFRLNEAEMAIMLVWSECDLHAR